MTARVSGGGRPTVFSIAAQDNFVDSLAAGIARRLDAVHLADAVVLLPNRRAVRALRDAFLRRRGMAPTLLPAMRPLGDLDEEDLAFALTGHGLDPTGDGLSLPPAIPPYRRQAMLARLVAGWRAPGGLMAPAQCWRLAGELATLMDQVDTAGVSYDALTEIVPADLASHWSVTLDFLKIISQHWPAILDDEKALNPAARRDRLIRALAHAWSATPPDCPVFAAGSTGTVPATAELLSVVARLPDGAVVLPGLERDMDEDSWAAAGPTHPQYAMKDLLKKMRVSRHEVEMWQGPEHRGEQGQDQGAVPPAVSTCSALLRDALRPAETTDVWPALPYSGLAPGDLFGGLSMITAPGRREEAAAIATVMREALETPGRTAALVTPDRQLARYTQAALARWNIVVDDTAGTPAAKSVPGRLLGLLVAAAADRFAPVPLLALLKHPMVTAGFERAAMLETVRRLDRYALRGPRPPAGLEGIMIRARAAAGSGLLTDGDMTRLERVAGILQPFDLSRQAERPVDGLMQAHIRACEALAASGGTPEDGPESLSGADRLWRGDAGEALADALGDLLEQAGMLGSASLEAYRALFDAFLDDVTVRPVWGRHPRLAILGPLEARLHRADVMILGSLNEGTWPAEIKPDPWMSAPMRAAFGLPPLERRIGQAAHDFLQAASGPRTILSRAEKADGSPTVKSRWLFRIEALAGRTIPDAGRYLDWSTAADGEAPRPAPPPAPCPPRAARPKTLSVTQVERWMRNPYGLYAQKVLGLRRLDPVDERPTASHRGTLLHAALERFLLLPAAERQGTGALDRLLAIGRDIFEPVLSQPTVYAFWWPRFERVAHWFIGHEADRAHLFETVAVERKASWPVPGTDFTLTAKADRIDRLRGDGALSIIDYKTGTPPSGKRVAAGYAPQLPLEGVLAVKGAFEGLAPAPVDSLVYWHLRGGDPVAQPTSPVRDVAEALEAAEDGLRALIAAFDDDAVPYLSHPRPAVAGHDDYDHLARVREWQAGQDPFAGDTGGEIP